MKMMFSAVSLVGFLSCIIMCHCQVKLPEYMKMCDRDSDDLNNCLEEAIKLSLPQMTDGIPEFDLPSLDPYREDEMKVEYRKNQIAAKVVVKNVLTYGLAGAKVHDVRAKVEDDTLDLEVDVTSPRVFVQGDYKAEGRYNTLHVNTRGKFNCTMTKLKYTWKLHGETEQIDGDTFVRITSFYMRPDVGDMLIYASNVFPDNAELSDLAIGIANQNWRVIYHEMLPYVQANWDKVGTKIANKLFLKVPYSQLFPISA